MRILAWNLNHRAARRPLPAWLAHAIADQRADVVVLTEYVEGPDHARFLQDLAADGLGHSTKTTREGRENEVLILTRMPATCGSLQAPAFHRSVPSNWLHLDAGMLDVVGFRMPAFVGRDVPRKRDVWEWLLGVLPAIRQPAVVVGDFNTQAGDPPRRCGDCLDRVQESGWRVAVPSSGESWRGHLQHGRRIDFALVSPGLTVRAVEYSWGFTALSPEGASPRVGLPDHAMLVMDLAL